MSHVKVGWPTFLTQVLWERLVGFRPGTFVGERIDALGPTINRIERKSATKATRQTRVQRVVIRVYVRCRNENRKCEIVLRDHGLDKELIYQTNQLVTRATLVTNGRRQLMWQ